MLRLLKMPQNKAFAAKIINIQYKAFSSSHHNKIKTVIYNNLKDPKIKKEYESLPEKYLDSEKHPKGKTFSVHKRVIAAKARAYQKGIPAANYSEIPGQKPIDLLMTFILTKGPTTRRQIWEDGKAGQYVNSRTHINALLKELIDYGFVEAKFVPESDSFVYRFCVQNAPLWEQYVAKVKKDREEFLRNFEAQNVTSFDANANEGDIAEETKENSELAKDGDEGEAEETKEEKKFKEMLWDGVGFVHKAKRTAIRGSIQMDRKIEIMRLLGKTGPLPRNHKRMKRCVARKQAEFAKTRRKYGLD